MQSILFDSLLWTEWISFILSIGVFGVFVLFENNIPDALKRIYKYGKSAESHQKSTLNKLEIPKSWFFHFYLFATVFYSYLLFSIVKVYIFNQELPAFTKLLLDDVVGQNRTARVPAESVLLSLTLILIQVIRRLIECLFVSVYSKAKMNIVHYVIAMLYYFAVGLSVLAEGNGLTNSVSFIKLSFNWTNLFTSRHLLGLALFVFASYLHNKSHHILASLRKNKEGKVINYSHVIPTGFLFEYVSSPHYFAEILIYISIAIVQCGLSLTWWLCVCFVVVNQVIMGLINHQWYINTFKDYPKKRKAVIPFLV